MRDSIHRHTALFHDLKKRRLRLRRSTVDLIAKKQVTVRRPGLILEFSRILIVNAESGNIRRHRIRRKLHTLIRQPQCP